MHDFLPWNIPFRQPVIMVHAVSSSWDKLTLATEEGTKLVCSSLFFLAFYKDRYKNRHGKIWRLFTWELSVRVCQDEWVSVCVLQHKKGEETLLVRPRTTYWASRTSSERVDQGNQRLGELLRENTLNTMVRMNTSKSSIPELLHKRAQEGRGQVWHPNEIHSENVDLFKDGVISDQSLVWAE